MPTYVALTIADLQAELNKQNAAFANYSDFTTRFARAFNTALTQYEEQLAQADDIFVRNNTYASPIAIGTAKITTTTGDVYQVTPPTDFRRIAGNGILVSKAATADFCDVPRMTFDSLITTGSSQTPFAFWEDHGMIMIYDKDGANFDNTSQVDFSYYRKLDATNSPTSTPLDIKQMDFADMVSTVLGLM